MHRTSMTRILRLAVAGSLLASCAAPLSSSEPSLPATAGPPTSSPPASARPPSPPTAAPTPAVAIGAHWEVVDGIRDVIEAARGDPGWVALKTCTWPVCGERDDPVAWYSSDGLTWSAGSVEHDRNVWFDSAAWSGTYVAAGMQFDDAEAGNDARVVVWHSADGRSWDVLERIELGECRAEGCQLFGPIAAHQSGQLVLGWVEGPSKRTSGIYGSADGATWTRIPASAFGRDDLSMTVMDVIPADRGFVLVGAPCRGCAVSAWTSDDGLDWQSAGQLAGDDPAVAISLASSGSRLVAAVQRCATDCRTELWSSTDGGQWTLDLEVAGLSQPFLGFTGPAFVLLGRIGLDARVLDSVDGETWSDVPTNLSLDDDCGIFWLASGPSAVLAGDPDCGAWYSSG